MDRTKWSHFVKYVLDTTGIEPTEPERERERLFIKEFGFLAFWQFYLFCRAIFYGTNFL